MKKKQKKKRRRRTRRSGSRRHPLYQHEKRHRGQRSARSAHTRETQQAHSDTHEVQGAPSQTNETGEQENEKVKPPQRYNLQGKQINYDHCYAHQFALVDNITPKGPTRGRHSKRHSKRPTKSHNGRRPGIVTRTYSDKRNEKSK
jgi:hypothetical protein